MNTGSSALIGSWKIMLICRPRTSRISRAADRQQVAALEAHLARDPALRARQQAQDRQAGHGLAAARFAHDAQPFAGLELKGDVACRLDLARADAEEDAKTTHVQQRRSVCRYQQSLFVSSLFFLEQTLAAWRRWSRQTASKRVNFLVSLRIIIIGPRASCALIRACECA